MLLVDVQSEYVHFADYIFERDKYINYEPIDKKDAVLISCEESRAKLADIGIEGEIISTARIAYQFYWMMEAVSLVI